MEMFRMEYFTKSESWNFAYDEMRYRTWKIKQRVSARNKTEKKDKTNKNNLRQRLGIFLLLRQSFSPSTNAQPDG